MINGQEKIIAIIPARAGSKRLPGKNTLLLAGRPCIQWTIDAALGYRQIDDVVVSTNDAKVSDLVSEHNNLQLIHRPAYLAQDTSSTVDVAVHALETLASRGHEYQWLLLLQPTSPLRTAADIVAAFDLLSEKEASGLVSICRTSHPREWVGTTTPGGLLEGFFQATELETRSNELPVSYTVNGAIYIVRMDVFLRERTFFSEKNIIGFEMSRESSVDIDVQIDFEFAEYLLKRKTGCI